AAFTPFLSDRSWMIRSAGLKVLKALGDRATGAAALPLLKDRSLIVRVEAVETVAALRPPGTVAALIATLESSTNYRAGKGQWVPERALEALATLAGDPDAKRTAPRLLPLLRHVQDPTLQRRTIQTLEALTGRNFKRDA